MLDLSNLELRLVLSLCDMHAESLDPQDVNRTVAILVAAKIRAVLPANGQTKFQVGQTYTCRSSCDHDTVYSWKVVARTAKMLTLEQRGKTEKRGVYLYEGVEKCRPYGSYSMAPSISADRRGEG